VDAKGCWPGDRSEYQAYLAHALAEIKYVTGEAPSHGPADCPLCGKTSTTLFPNALKGVGINFSNMDRAGAFPGLDTGQAWKGYGLCLDCADLLYIFLYRDGSFRFKTLVNGYNIFVNA
jgi:CRISPR-associated protein Csh1